MIKELENGHWHSRILSWQDLGQKVGLTCSEHTIQRAMNKVGYHKCRACQKGYLSPKQAKTRFDFALERILWNSEGKKVIFSDESHFCLNQRRTELVIRKPGERFHPDCIQINRPKSTI